MLSVMLMGAALAIDHGRHVTAKLRDQAALDAAILAASDQLGLPEQDTAGPEKARAFYRANIGEINTSTMRSVTFDAATGEIEAVAGDDLATTLMRAFGYETMKVGVRSKVARGSSSVEVALVLDNSGSMGASSGTEAGTYIGDLKVAARNLLGVVFAGAEGTDKVKMAVVPFASSVNVGSAYRGASWIDGDAESSIHTENFAEARRRFDLFAELGVAWRGCVEARPDSPSTSRTLLRRVAIRGLCRCSPSTSRATPAPTTSATRTAISTMTAAAACPIRASAQVVIRNGGPARAGRRRACPMRRPKRAPASTAARCRPGRLGPTPAARPSRSCRSIRARQTIEDAIDVMEASGNTNISEGLMWGWRALSPGEPFSEGRPYETGDNSKYLVLMTDGENFLNATSNHNKSVYASYGYAAKGRLGTTYSSSGYTAKLNERTRAACANAKSAGITIFTVAFRLEDNPDAQALLRECASGGEKALTAANGDALNQAFQNIGRQISRLRVAG